MSIVLVTGATGFIGSHVARDLMSHGRQVRTLVRSSSLSGGRWPDGVEVVEGDILDGAAVRAAAEGCEAIVHVAAEYSLARRRAASIERTNVEGTANVIAAARASAARLVHTSSVATIGLPSDGALGDEDTPLDPRQVIGAYKRSKVASERLVQAAAADGLWATIVNPTAPVGPGDWKPTPTGRIVRDFLRGRLTAYVDTGLNVVDVRDVATGHRLALELGRPGGRYILGNRNMTLREILSTLAEITGRPAPRHRVPHAVALGVAAASELVEGHILRREPFAPLDGARMARKHMFVDSSRAIAELGLPQSDFRAALRDAVEWYERPPAAKAIAISAEPR